MNVPNRTLLAGLIVGLVTASFQSAPAEAAVTVQNLELVSVQSNPRGGDAEKHTYRLAINNEGTTLNDVKVYVSCRAKGTTIVDSVAEFGDIPENSVSISTGTFSLFQIPQIPFNPECLVYEVGFATTVKLSGRVTDRPLPDAVVIGIVTRPDSGRPIIESGRPIIETFTTTADADGNYELNVEAVTEEDFITLEAMGTGDDEGAVLTSSLGSVSTLQELGESGSIIVDNGDYGALNITHITTALDELVRRLNGGVPPTNDAELAALQAQVDGAELLLLATTIKTVIDNPNVVLPPGINTTLELIQQDPATVDAFTQQLQTDFPDEIEAPLLATADELQLGYSPEEIVGTLYAVQDSEVPLQGAGAYVFDFGVNGDGSVTSYFGTSPITWLLNASGDIEITLVPPLFLFESFPTCTYPGQINNQCRTEVFLEAIRIVRLADGIDVDQALILETRRTTYPDDPLPDEVVESAPSPNAVYLTFTDEGIIPVEPADIADTQIALYYFHGENDSAGLTSEELGADVLTFDANGSGVTQRRGFDFTWSIDALGAVDVEFSNGDSNRYLVFDTSDIGRALLIGSVAGGTLRAYTTDAIELDGNEFTEAMLQDRRYRAVFAIVDPTFSQLDTFDFLFQSGGTGCRITGFQGENFPRRMEWESTPENFMDSFLFLSPDSDIGYQRRAWQAIRVEPGILGDRYWVIEVPDFGNSIEDPNYVYADPATTPGRITAYEFVEDIGGQLDPCGLGISGALDTLFDSDNGGVGNMFDVTTFGNEIEVTGFDVNVNFPVGTDFEITVYTTPGGYDNGITSGLPGCTLFCVDVVAWIPETSGTGTSAGVNQPSFVPVSPFLLDAGTTTGVWISLARDGIIVDEFRYTNGSGVAEDANIEIDLGAGVGVGDTSTGLEPVFLDRIWNGTIYYNAL